MKPDGILGFMSIGRALNCRMRIQRYAVAHDLESHMTLSRRDWEILENIYSTLHTYYEATLCGEGRDHHLRYTQ
jgi:hypothetical protein